LNDEVQSLLDKQAITEVLYRYCRGVDRCDVEQVDSIYWDDAVDDHGYWKGPGPDFGSFVCNRLMEANESTTHTVTNVLIEVENNRAWSESQVLVHLIRRDTFPRTADVMAGRYLDKFSKRSDEWRIDERTVVLDWTTTYVWDAKPPPLPLEEFTWGKRGGGQDSVFKLMPSLRGRIG
jgi:SnoaL-like domain